eukprot:6512481-Alexandrium_andersonii.AAC.1
MALARAACRRARSGGVFISASPRGSTASCSRGTPCEKFSREVLDLRDLAPSGTSATCTAFRRISSCPRSTSRYASAPTSRARAFVSPRCASISGS